MVSSLDGSSSFNDMLMTNCFPEADGVSALTNQERVIARALPLNHLRRIGVAQSSARKALAIIDPASAN